MTGARGHDAVGTFRHEAYLYASPAQFARDMAAFVLDGLRSGESVAVAETPDKIAVLREHLGADARHVRFLDMVEIGRNPARITAVWEDLVARSLAERRGMRGIGEPAWPGRRTLELAECRVHELLLNTAFDHGPAWWLVCPYDVSGLPEDAVADALRTHPTRLQAGLSHANDGYDAATVAGVFSEPLPPPPVDVHELGYDARSVAAVRSVVHAHAVTCGLPVPAREDVVLAAWEVAVNSLKHGGGSGRLRVWREPEAMVSQVDDAGHITDPLVGRRAPSIDDTGSRGVFLANQLCDLVQLRSNPDGTTVRLLAWL